MRKNILALDFGGTKLASAVIDITIFKPKQTDEITNRSADISIQHFRFAIVLDVTQYTILL